VRFVILVSLVLLAVSQPSFGRMLFVEKDGSGDYVTIPEAVIAAASGDTIMIGPGRFDDLMVEVCIPSNFHYRVVVLQEDLTLIGVGSDLESDDGCTIIGPEEPPPSNARQHGIASYEMCGAQSFFIRGIRFENLNVAIHAGTGELLQVEDCTFWRNYRSIETDFPRVKIARCGFEAAEYTPFFVILSAVSGPRQIEFNDCTFRLDSDYDMIAIGGSGEGPISIGNCDFFGTTGERRGIGFSGFFEPASIKDCSFSDLNYGVRFYGGGEYFIKDSFFEKVKFGLYDLGAHVYIMNVDGCVFSDVDEGSISYQTLYAGHVRDCILAKGQEFVISSTYNNSAAELVKNEDQEISMFLKSGGNTSFDAKEKISVVVAPQEEYRFDMRNNWWGSAEPDSIQAWIEDGLDIPDYPFYVDWEPHNGGPVNTEKNSLDSFKAKFR